MPQLEFTQFVSQVFWELLFFLLALVVASVGKILKFYRYAILRHNLYLFWQYYKIFLLMYAVCVPILLNIFRISFISYYEFAKCSFRYKLYVMFTFFCFENYLRYSRFYKTWQ